MSPSSTIDRLREICAEVGFDFSGVNSVIVARLLLLAQDTETVADSERMAARARDVFRYYDVIKPAAALTEAERRIVVLGCLFSDIGKTGPASAGASSQRLIAEMFAVEGVADDRQPVARFLSAHFPADAGERARRFAALGLDPEMPIRELWNLHSTWTLEILAAGGVPAEVIAAAATHHLLDEINPQAVVGADGRFTRPFGANAAFDRAEKLIILLDKYDAVRRRGRQTHAQAIAWLRQRIETNRHFHDDQELSTLLADLDAALD